jgi:hypothetical protein
MVQRVCRVLIALAVVGSSLGCKQENSNYVGSYIGKYNPPSLVSSAEERALTPDEIRKLRAVTQTLILNEDGSASLLTARGVTFECTWSIVEGKVVLIPTGKNASKITFDVTAGKRVLSGGNQNWIYTKA